MAIPEVAVHKGCRALDTVSHVLTSLVITDPSMVYVVQPQSVPNTAWLIPGLPGSGQQEFGDRLLHAHKFIAIPSAVSRHSWNLLFIAEQAAGAYRMRSQEDFGLDTRLNPPLS